MSQLTIGITDCSKYNNYFEWIRRGVPNAKIIQLGYQQGNFDDLCQCHGVVLSGGEDVHPRFYGKPEYYKLCYQDDVNEQRDEFEWRILEYTEKNCIPVLGICRGLQFFNVFAGGTLIPDLPTWDKASHAKLADGTDRYHDISIEPTSWLYSTCGLSTANINSNHHQCADLLGKDLRVSAWSDERVPEALERPHSNDKPFICLVQWHPERMKNPESPLSAGIRGAFLEVCNRI